MGNALVAKPRWLRLWIAFLLIWVLPGLLLMIVARRPADSLVARAPGLGFPILVAAATYWTALAGTPLRFGFRDYSSAVFVALVTTAVFLLAALGISPGSLGVQESLSVFVLPPILAAGAGLVLRWVVPAPKDLRL